MRFHDRTVGCCLLALVLGLTACGEGAEVAGSLARQTIGLASPATSGSVSLEETLSARRSVRAYTTTSLTNAEISQLLWAAQGVTREGRGRTAPSAGALYPLEVYVATADGVFHYRPEEHDLEVVTDSDRRARLSDVALGQDPVRDAAAVFVVSAVFDRTAVKYGARAERYVHLEAGHAAHGLLLQAVALGLGGVPIGAFDDEGVQGVLGLPADHDPLYLIPVGHPSD